MMTQRGMGIGLRFGALAVVLAAAGCARSGPPAPVIQGADLRSPTFESEPYPAPAAGPAVARSVQMKPVRWAPLPPAPVPGAMKAEPARPAPAAAPPSRAGQVKSSTQADVRVHRGDTLYSISRRHRIPLRALIAANGLKPPYHLAVGRKLRVPETRYYVVGHGDTLYSLSRRFKVKPAHLIRVNRIEHRGRRLYPGQKLLIPGAGPAPATKTKTETRIARAIAPAKPDRRSPAIKAHAMAVPKRTLKAPPIVKRRKPALKAKPAAEPAAKVQHASIPVPPPPPARPKTAPKQTAKRAALPRREGGFVWPVKGRLLSAYGSKGNGLYNDGINIAAKSGAPVRAAESGVVAYAGNELKGYGNLLLIRHAGGWVSAYAHTSRILVSKGQTVRRGQTVARVGQSGAVDAPQLHFELRRGPQAVDPLPHLKKTKG